MIDLGLVSNGSNDAIGDLDEERMSGFFDKAVPILEKIGATPADGLTVDDLYTNEYIDTSIGLK
jgi:hypothetical protein